MVAVKMLPDITSSKEDWTRRQTMIAAAIVGSIVGAVAFAIAGIVVGTLFGMLLAPFTMLLSLPAGAFIGVSFGGLSGAVLGAIVAAVFAYFAYPHTNEIASTLGPLCSRAGSMFDMLTIQALTALSAVMRRLKPALAKEAKWQAGDYERKVVQDQIKSHINSAPVVVYSLQASPFAMMAKRLLAQNVDRFKVIELGPTFLPGVLSTDAAAIRAELTELFGQSSLPHIFVQGKSIGGLIDGAPGLVPLLKAGDLQQLLKSPKSS